jgi:hypothetical protein
MPLFLAVAVVGALYGVLTFWILPRFKKVWTTAAAPKRIAQAGLVAGLTTVQTFAQIALLTYGAVLIVLFVLGALSPTLGAGLLVALHGMLLDLKEWIGAAKAGWGKAFLWVAFAGLIWFAWRARRRGLRSILIDEQERQVADLIDKAQAGGLPELPSDPMMTTVEQQIGEIDALLDGLHRSGQPGPEILGPLTAARDQAIGRWIALDITRRVDLTAVAADDPAGSGWWPKIRLALLSKGLQDINTAVGGWTAKASTAIACLLVVGISGPLIAGGMVPAIDSIADVQIARNEKEAAETLKNRAPLDQPVQPSAEDSVLYRAAAQQFVAALASSELWSASVKAEPRPRGAQAADFETAERRIENLAVRASILDEYSRSEPARGLKSASPGSAGRPEQKDFEAYQAGRETGPAPGAVEAVEKRLAAAGARSPGFRDRLKTSLAKFRQPASAWDFASTLIGQQLSDAAKLALADPALASTAELQRNTAARKLATEAMERLVQIKFAGFLEDIANGAAMGEALRKVRSNDPARTMMRIAEANEIAGRLGAIDSSRSAILDHSDRRAPTLVQSSPRAEAKGASAIAEIIRNKPIGQSMSDVRAQLAGAYGSYDDLFVGHETSLTQSGLSRAIPVSDSTGPAPDVGAPSASPGGGPPLFEKTKGPRLSTAEFRTARSFRILRGSFRVGGVLIGADPARASAVDFTGIEWRASGNGVRILLKPRSGQLLDLGTFPAAIVQQALAYAADARPVAATMTDGLLAPGAGLKVHIHPALVDTELGCEIVELDRFVDTATSKNPELKRERSRWGGQVLNQVGFYNFAIAMKKRLDQGDPLPADKGGSVAKVRSLVFPAGWNPADPKVSIFAALPNRFSPQVLQAIRSCDATSDTSYWNCVVQQVPEGSETQVAEAWSGVREADYLLTPATLTAMAQRSADPRLLRFLVQVAFETRGDENEDPWEFGMLAGQIASSVDELIRSNPRNQKIVRDAATFTLLQRVFRAALSDRLGKNFPTRRLVELMRDARKAAPVPFVFTPQWSWPRESAARSHRDNQPTIEMLRSKMRLAARMNSDAVKPALECLQSLDGSDLAHSAQVCHPVIDENLFGAAVAVGLSDNYLADLLADPDVHFADAGTCV